MRGAVPLVVTVKLKASPTMAVAVAAEVRCGRVRVVMVNVRVSLPAALSAVRKTCVAPSAVGVPESSPDAAENESHAGSAPVL